MTKHKSQDRRRAEILEAARRCFIQNGYAATRVDDIAEAADLSKGGIYFHFRSKKEIFHALFDRELEENMARLLAVRSAESNAVDRLLALAELFVSHFATDEEHRRLILVLAEMGLRDEELLEKVQAWHERYVEALTEELQRGMDAGELRSLDARSVALALKLFIDGVEQAHALDYSVDAMELIPTAYEIVLRGLLPPAD